METEKEWTTYAHAYVVRVTNSNIIFSRVCIKVSLHMFGPLRAHDSLRSLQYDQDVNKILWSGPLSNMTRRQVHNSAA